jgi:broad specificity phosphatase PhoE
MSTVYFITHPDVVIDPAVPVQEWPLSERGRARMKALAEQNWMSGLRAIYCSTERKAIDGAMILAEGLALSHSVVPELGENDRSSTGYLPAKQFAAVVAEFFGKPDESVYGWERAVDAQRRIVTATTAVLRKDQTDGDVAIVAAESGHCYYAIWSTCRSPRTRTNQRPTAATSSRSRERPFA